MGGIAKNRVLEVFRPHIFFDDQMQHIEGVAGSTPSAHVPFGIANEPSPELTEKAHAERVWMKNRDRKPSALPNKALQPSSRKLRRQKATRARRARG